MAHTEIIIDEDGNISMEGIGFKDNTCSLDSALIANALEAEVDTKTEKIGEHRLNSSHITNSYAVFCLKTKTRKKK